jgi:hypothetical protein
MLTNLRNRPQELPHIEPPEKPPVFVTAYLWKLLVRPVRWHPLFERYTQRDLLHFQNPIGTTGRIVQGMALALWLGLLVLFPQTVFPLTVISLALVPFLLVVFSGTWLGLVWALTISNSIITEHVQRRYTLLSMIPRGAPGISWLIATARLHRRNWLRDSHRIVRGLALFIVPVLMIIILLTGISLLLQHNVLYNQQLSREVIHTMSPVVAALLILWLDNIQSAILACLCGILIPDYLTNRRVHLITGTAFLSLQIFSYTVIVSLTLLLDAILRTLTMDETLSVVLLCGSTVCLFYIVREALIGLLWRRLLQRFHIDADEFYTLARI